MLGEAVSTTLFSKFAFVIIGVEVKNIDDLEKKRKMILEEKC